MPQETASPFRKNICRQCGNSFSQVYSYYDWCSDLCFRTYWEFVDRLSAEKVCPGCREPFKPKCKNQRFCTKPACKSSRLRKSKPSTQSTSTVGAGKELLVCVELLNHGYHVFRSVSPTAICDLVVIAPDGKLLRVEVTKGTYSASGKLVFAYHDPDRYDLLAVATDSQIVFVPPI